MIFRPFLRHAAGCASYLLGCGFHRKLALVDAHVELVPAHLGHPEEPGSPFVAVFDFADALLDGVPPPPDDRAANVAANLPGASPAAR